MRRKIITKKAVVLIIVIAIFTILSYVSDQLAIRQEDSLRVNKIKFDNLSDKVMVYRSLDNQLSAISRRSSKIVENSLRNKNIWIKSYLAINLKNSNKIKFKEYFKNINESEKYTIKVALIDNFITSIKDNFYIEEKLWSIYSRNETVFPEDVGENVYEDYYDYKRVIKENVDLLNHKIPDFYSDLLIGRHWGGEKLENILKEFDKEHWLDINLLTVKLIKNIDMRNLDVDKNIDFLNEKISINTKKKSKTLELIKYNSSLKNYFILSSIISQVFSLLFLLILFRNLLLQNKI